MIEWSSPGIIIARKPLGERDAKVVVFTESSGIVFGVLKNWGQKKYQALQLGDYVMVTWRARLSEHMGTWQIEPLKAYGSVYTMSRAAADVLGLALDVCRFFLPERHPYPKIYNRLLHFLDEMFCGGRWLYLYVLFELHLLHDVGFGLKLKKCAVTGLEDNLMYVSPKTGCAVTEDVGAPYREKLFRLPAFMVHDMSEDDVGEIKKGLSITGYFLETLFRDKKYKELFDKRKRFIISL